MASELPCLKTNRLTLNNISLEDTADIVAWRSDPKIYCYFLSPHPIKEEEHINWFKNRYLQDDDRCDWMAFDDKNEPVGVFGIRRECSDSVEAEVSYILAPNKKGKGYAREAVLKLIEYATKVWNTKIIIAEIHIENKDSIRFAKNLGMKITSIKGNFCTYQMTGEESTKQVVYIRCDGNQEIGIGHVMRCLAIAEQIKKLGSTPVFLIADDTVENLITEKNYATICLNTVWNNLELEMNLLENLLSGNNRESILVDSYYVTTEYLKKLSSFADVTYMDDLCLERYDIKNLVNYNYYALELEYDKLYGQSEVSLFLGPKFAPLRAEFANKQSRTYAGLNKILITTGGTDNYNVLDYLLNYFAINNNYKDIYAIVGKFNVNRDQIIDKYGDCKGIHLLTDVKDMQEYMSKCDLCITAGGMTIYELCACGTPSFMYVLADNQFDAAKEFDRTQLIPCLGDVRTELNNFSERIDILLSKYSNREYWEKINKQMLSIVDAKGADRVAKVLCNVE